MVISSLYAALATLLVVVLFIRVVGLRRRLQVGLGDGGHAVLARAIRAHANAVETLPLGLLLLLLAELGGAAALLLHLGGATLLLGRVLHAWGLSGSSGYSIGRFSGTLATLLAWLFLAAMLLYRSLLA